MITDLEIINFQSHKHTTMEFSPGVNVILGQSDVGKSSIIRAIKWVEANRPSGDSFRANFTKDKTEVALAFGDDFVSRQKGKSFNGYELEDEKLKALRTDVPQEVKDITKMEEVNIQPQYKSYFLLDESPGNVAKAFNSVSGLEEMDAALKEVNSRVRATSSALTLNLKETVVIEEEIKNLSWAQVAEKKLQEIEELEAGLQRTHGICTMLKDMVRKLGELQNKVKELPDFSALPKINAIFILDRNVDEKINHQNTLCDLLDSLSKKEEKLKRYDVLDTCDLSKTAEISQQIDTKTNSILSIYQKSEAISEKRHMLSRNKVELKTLRKIYLDTEAELKICPTCNQYILEES